VEDEADDALVRVRPVFGNLIVKLVQVVDHRHRMVHLALVLLACRGDYRSLAINELAQPGDHALPHRDRAGEVADSDHHGVCSILVTHVTKCDNLLAGLTGFLSRHGGVSVRGRRASDVGSGEKDDTVVVFTEAEVEGAGALVVGRLERGNREAECGRERLAELGDGVEERVEGEEFRTTNRVGHLRFAKSNLNLGEAS